MVIGRLVTGSRFTDEVEWAECLAEYYRGKGKTLVFRARDSAARFVVVVVDVVPVVSFVSVGRVVVELICEEVRALDSDGSLVPYRRHYCASVGIELSRK